MVWEYAKANPIKSARAFAARLFQSLNELRSTVSPRPARAPSNASFDVSALGDDVVTVTKLQFLEAQLAELRALMQQHGVVAPGASRMDMSAMTTPPDSVRSLRSTASELDSSFQIPHGGRADVFTFHRSAITLMSPQGFGVPSAAISPVSSVRTAPLRPQSPPRMTVLPRAAANQSHVTPSSTTSTSAAPAPMPAPGTASAACGSHARTQSAPVPASAPAASPAVKAGPTERPNMMAVLGAAKELKLKSVAAYVWVAAAVGRFPLPVWFRAPPRAR